MAPTILRTEGVMKAFGGVRAVDGVSIAVREGELRCLIGPNGAGKSTFFALLTGLQRPDAGRIFLKDRDVTHAWAHDRVRWGLGLKFQTNRAYHNLTVGANLEIARGGQGASAGDGTAGDTRYRMALEMSGLADALDVPARELPHSQLQWLEICMALAKNPSVLLLDEPTTGMTPAETAQTADLVRKLNAEGLTIIAVEHDMAFVRAVAETVTVLHQGQVFVEGSIEEVSANEDVKRIYLGDS